MSLSLSQNYTAISPNLTAYFLANGGTAPYTYSVRPNGAGGSIDSSSGQYTAPAAVSSNPKQLYDTIQAEDADGAIKTAQILIGSPLHLVGDILQTQLGLDSDHIYFWDQKIFEPKDFSLYIALAIASCKPFSNNNAYDGAGSDSQSLQYSNWQAVLNLDVISRGFDAVTRKEEVLMALMSNYSQSQQEANSFKIGRLPPGARFVNMSQIDGAAIPYRFSISVSLLYVATLTTDVSYYDTFTKSIATNP